MLVITALVSMLILNSLVYGYTRQIIINSDLYNEISQNSELAAEISPADFNLTNSYLTAYEIMTFYESMHLPTFLTKMKDLEEKYMEEYEYWREALPEGDLKLNSTELAFNTAKRFYKVINNDYIPAIKEKDITNARLLLNSTITPIYQEHIFYIERSISEVEKVEEEIIGRTESLLRLYKLFIIFIPIILIVILVLMGFMVTGSIYRSMNQVLKGFETASKGDFSQPVTKLYKDELGVIGNDLNTMMDSVSLMISDVKQTSDNLSTVGNELHINMTTTSTSINEISRHISDINGRISDQNEGVIETRTSVNEIVTRIEKLNFEVENQSASVVESSSSVEQMVANISSVNNALEKNSHSIRELQLSTEEGRNSMTEVSDHIREITSESETLLDTTQIIKNIADQTNLLAMNAAIEAAHAGDAGKGFAVVADEIRKLAEDSASQVATINATLEKFRNSILSVSKYTETTQEQFEDIFRLSGIVNDQGLLIKNAMEEQNAGGKEILQAMEEITLVTESVRNFSKEVMGSSQEVLTEMENFETITSDINSIISDISENSNEIVQSTKETENLSHKNQEAVKHLSSEVSKFKISTDIEE